MDKRQLLALIAVVLTTTAFAEHDTDNRNPFLMWYPIPIKPNKMEPSTLLRNFAMTNQENPEESNNFDQGKDKCAEFRDDSAFNTKQSPSYQLGGNYPLYPEIMSPYNYPGGSQYTNGNAPLPYYIFGSNTNGNNIQYPYYLNWMQQQQQGMPLINENNGKNYHKEDVNQHAPTTVQTEVQTDPKVDATTHNENLTTSLPLETRPDSQSHKAVGTRGFTETPSYSYTTVKNSNRAWVRDESEEGSVTLQAESLTKTTADDQIQSSDASQARVQHEKSSKYKPNEEVESKVELKAVTGDYGNGAKSSANYEVTENTTKFSRVLENYTDEESPMDLQRSELKDDNNATQGYTESSTDLESPVIWTSEVENYDEPLMTAEDREYLIDSKFEYGDETLSTDAYPPLNARGKTSTDVEEDSSQNLTAIFRNNSTVDVETKDSNYSKNSENKNVHTKSTSIEDEYLTEQEPAKVAKNHKFTTAPEKTTIKNDEPPSLKGKVECLANLSTKGMQEGKHKKAHRYHDDESRSESNNNPEVGMAKTRDNLNEIKTTILSYLTDEPEGSNKTTSTADRIYKPDEYTKTVESRQTNKDIYPTLPTLIDTYLNLTVSENPDLRNTNNSEFELSSHNGNCTCLYKVIQQLLMELIREKQTHSSKSFREKQAHLSKSLRFLSN